MFKKITSCILIMLCMFSSLSMTSFASTTETEDVITPDSEYYLSAEEIYNGDYFSAEELEAATEDGAIILCGIDAPMSELSNSIGNARGLFSARVWCRSYATYDEDDGVSVHVELYVPWYYFANPKFTAMEGAVSVTLAQKTTTKAFAKLANQAKTISTDVEMGNKAASGTEGKVSVAGWATGANIESGYGEFASAYEITIP